MSEYADDVTKVFASEVFALANIEGHQETRIQTIQKSMEGYSRKEVKRAIMARVAQSKVAHPPDSKFKLMVNSPSLENCKVTVQDITNSRTMFGPNLPGLQGRSTRQKPKRVVPEYMGIPRAIYERYKYVTLTADVVCKRNCIFGLPFSGN